MSNANTLEYPIGLGCPSEISDQDLCADFGISIYQVADLEDEPLVGQALMFKAVTLTDDSLANLAAELPAAESISEAEHEAVVSLELRERAEQQNLISRIEMAGFTIYGPTDVRCAEQGEPAWVCNMRARIAEISAKLTQ